MPKYLVEIPIAGKVWTEVKAGSEKEAIEKAFDAEFDANDIEYELHKIIAEGNVFCGMLNRPIVTLLDDEEEV